MNAFAVSAEVMSRIVVLIEINVVKHNFEGLISVFKLLKFLRTGNAEALAVLKVFHQM